MAKEGVFGVASFKMQNAAANGFPEDWTDAFDLQAIVKDSLNFNDASSTENDIEVEDMDNFYASLPSSLAAKGFAVQTYDMSAETYAHLCGYEKQGDWYQETPGWVLENQAVQIVTKSIADFPAKTFEWATMSCKVTRTGTVGKSGFPNFNLEFKQLATTDASGKEIPGARWKHNA